MAKELKGADFDEAVKSGKTIVDFWAPWCGPCRSQGPILDQLEKEADGIQVCKVNVDEEEELARRFGVMSIPTLIVFDGGQPVTKAVGLQSLKNLKKLIG